MTFSLTISCLGNAGQLTHPADPWARLLYIAMWNWADDAGVGTANLRELAGFAFPNDDHVDSGAMRRLCAEVSAHYGAQFYTVGARPYYCIPTWRDHQKFDNRRGGKHPGPDQAETWLYQDISEEPARCADMSAHSRRSDGAVTGEQGNRGTGEQGTTTPSESHESERATRESSSTFSDGTPIPDEPPADTDDERAAIAEIVPTEIGTAARPTPVRAEPAHRTTVRMVLGDAGYPQATIDQLARQVAKLAGKHDAELIAESLREWDRRPNVKPAYLASILGDVVKARRAQPEAPKSKLRSLAELAAEERAHEQLANPARKELA